MSCETLNRLAVQLSVSVASLPEGFCPASMQELANAIGERLLISPNSDFNTFAIGSVEPTTNVGPWFKNCETWFYYDDSTARYLPIPKGGFDSQIYATSSGSFTVPEDIYKIEVEIWGGGGGGCADGGGSTPGGGGGAGGYCRSIIAVTPGQIIPYSVGSGGNGGTPGSNGGNTTLLTLTAGGGGGGPTGSGFGSSGAGGTATGGDINILGTRGGIGIGGSNNVGSGGASPNGGGGGVSQSVTAAGLNGITPGGGGSGGITGILSGATGNGAGGAVLIRW